MKGKIWLIFFVALTLVYRLTLDYIYAYIISPVWEYQHFVLDFDKHSYILSFIWLALISLFDYYLYKDNRPSSNFLLFTDILFFIPMSSIIPLSGMSSSFFIFCVIYWLILAFFQLRKIRRKSFPFQIPDKTISNTFFLLAFLLILINFAVTVYYNGFKIKFDLSSVYDIRFAVRDMHLPTLIQYLKPLASKVTLLTIVVMIVKKNYKWVVILTFVQLMNFAFGALKSDLFALLLAYIIGFLFKPHHRQYLLYGLVLSNVIVILEYTITGVSFISIVVHRRVLFMPPLLSYEYFDFFSSNECVYLRDSFMRYLGYKSPYSLEIPRLIGAEFYGDQEMNCNTGIVGDDFAQLGWLALLFFPWLRVKLLDLYDKICTSINYKIVIYISFVYALVFISGTFFSSLLTGGFIGICILIALMKKRVKI